MKFITASSGQLVELSQWQAARSAGRTASTGVPGLDELYGGKGPVRGAIHELLHPEKAARPVFVAMLLARGALGITQSPRPVTGLTFAPDLSQLPPEKPTTEDAGVIVISDPKRELYPPAAAQLGLPLSRLYLLHPANRQQELWAIGECLASAGVSAVVAELGKLNQVEARRLQLAAERGGSMGLLIRPNGKVSEIYAAATRMLVTPAPATAIAQRWNIQVLHGHGCPAGKGVLLEYNREEHTLHTAAPLADHKTAAKTRRATA